MKQIQQPGSIFLSFSSFYISQVCNLGISGDWCRQSWTVAAWVVTTVQAKAMLKDRSVSPVDSDDFGFETSAKKKLVGVIFFCF